jgi:hypothetical protein
MIGDLKQAREQAKRLAGDEPPEWGWFLWCEERYQRAKLDPMPVWWARHYRAFAASGASELVAAKGTRGGGSTNWVGWELSQLLFCPKIANASVELVLPVMGATVAHANGRALNFHERLRALGYEQLYERQRLGKRRGDGDETDAPTKARVGDGQFWGSQPSANGINTIEFRDLEGRLITIRTACASKASASEMTACDFFGDEVAQWGEAENTRQVLTLGRTRLKGQRPGKSYLISQPLPDTEFYEICRAGSNRHRYVCTLGEDGVEMDRRARLWLRDECIRESRASGAHGRFFEALAKDARIHEDLDPATPWNPAWAILPVGADREQGPEAAMRECCRLALLDIGRADGLDPLQQLWWGFGARPMAAGAHRWVDAQKANELISPRRRAMWESLA